MIRQHVSDAVGGAGGAGSARAGRGAGLFAARALRAVGAALAWLWAAGCASTVSATQGDGGADAGTPPIVDLVAAGPNTCALRSDGRVRCWGRYGRTDDPTAPPVGAIAEVAGLTDAVRVAVRPDADARGCAVRASGEVACWSTNAAGAVGRPAAAALALPARARDVAMGASHACALTVDGAVLCWGDNTRGELGAGDFGAHPGVVAVIGLPVVEELAAWESNTCARSADGAVFCWGRNYHGALGDGLRAHDCPSRAGDEDCSAVPVRVVGIGPAERLSVGLNTACALVAGVPFCWGWSVERFAGDAGVGATTRVGDLRDVVEVFAGYITGAAIRRGGEVVTWGTDFATQPDAGGPAEVGAPRTVAGVERARRVTGGWYHLCALAEGGEVWCWGNGGFGELARPGPIVSGPVRIDGL
jgi:hypothetical protein